MHKQRISLFLCISLFMGISAFAAPVGSIDGYSWETKPLHIAMPAEKKFVVQPQPGDSIGSAQTTYSEDSSHANRNENMRLATAAINGVILQPGEIFSYSYTLGPRTAERGYKIATVFQGNKKVPGLGGGICQISSTLYMATKQAGLQIVERHPHTLPVSYCSREDEATVAWGLIDYRFKNSLDVPICIEASMGGGVCTVTLRKTG